jgi:tRNA modification GTPase
MTDRDPIAAIATAPGMSGVGIVRVSGVEIGALIQGLLGKTPQPRRATLATFRDARGAAIDQGIALYFPAPNSYTGEHVLELQGHGGPVVLREVLSRCLELGARVARPGEFTQRAYLNDRIDLAQAEGVADLIGAATAEAARCALRSLQGVFSERIHELERVLVDLRALVEATLDFPDEEIDFLQQADAFGRLARLKDRLQELLSVSRQGSLLREGVQLVLAGRPNVGKSSLLNQLAGDELAIVTDIPGTTRDAIRQTVNLEGIPAHVIDTAGLRHSDDPVERIGIERAWSAIEKADLVLLVIDATAGEQESDREILHRLPEGLPCIRLMNKVDLLPNAGYLLSQGDPDRIWLSAKTGAGLDRVRKAILEKVGIDRSPEGLFMARERHLQALQEARRHLERAGEQGDHLELFAEELRLAHECLGDIVGECTPDDLLGEIFGRFCIGK